MAKDFTSEEKFKEIEAIYNDVVARLEATTTLVDQYRASVDDPQPHETTCGRECQLC